MIETAIVWWIAAVVVVGLILFTVFLTVYAIFVVVWLLVLLVRWSTQR